MFKNYITTALRNLVRNKLYSLINIGGLALGLAAVILIGVFVRYEFSYDTWIPGADNIYQVGSTVHYPGRPETPAARGPVALAPALTSQSVDIAAVTRLMQPGTTVKLGDQTYNETVSYVDGNFFEFFDLPMMAGQREQITTQNNAVIISENMALKYFGQSNPIGETLIIFDNGAAGDNPNILYEVSGVFKNIPDATHFTADFIVLFDTGRYGDAQFMTSWTTFIAFTYVKLQPGVTVQQFEANLIPIAKALSAKNLVEPETVSLHPLNILDIHLHSDIQSQPTPGGDYQITVTFAVVAVLIMIIGAINFTNLATAQAMKRAREVGLRKTFGASRKQLIRQFLGEAFLTNLIALFMAALVSQLLLPFFNGFLGLNLVLDFFGDPFLGFGMIGVVLITTFLGGVYPAFVLSGFRPMTALRDAQSSGQALPWLSNALVILQFSISVTLIAVTTVIYAQTLFGRDFETGFNKENKVTFSVSSDFRQSMFDEVGKVPGVVGTTTASRAWPLQGVSDVRVTVDADPVLVEIMLTATNFFELYEVEPVAGRLFSDDYKSDFRNQPIEEEETVTWGVVVNETLVQRVGFTSPEDAVNKTMRTGNVVITIVGVVSDLKIRSIEKVPVPMMFLVFDQPLEVITADVRGSNLTATTAAIQDVWARVSPGSEPLALSFVDDDFASLYQADKVRALTFAGTSLFAVFIASLGLFGLAAFAAERRTMEIGLRKVMGAQVFDMVKLLIWQFSKPVLWANIVAWPVTAYFMYGWLQGFAYRLDNSVIVGALIGAALTALAIAWFTVGGHAFNVARKNPIKSLHYE